MTEKIGVFAGTFDPIHEGHLEVANAAIEFLELDKLMFMVEEQPWGSKNPVALKHRQKMVDLGIRVNNKISQLSNIDSKFTVSKTLPFIQSHTGLAELYFIFGADVFLKMNSESWPDLSELLEHYIVVFERKDITEKEISNHAKSLGVVTAIIPSKHSNHSSTDVRLKPHNSAVWVPKKVADYITENKLYS